MSIAVLNQVYDEARRLAVAGSVVARGDFRLRKLVPPLEQAGAKAPVFAKVAEAANKVIEGPEDASVANLLELTALVTAVLYTQGETGMPGDLKPVETINLGGELTQTSARLLKPLLEALKSTGSGRLELVKEAHERGAFRDLRLITPALGGLDDPYPELADFIAEKVLPLYGKAILPELRRTYDPAGTKGHPRRLKLMHALDPAGTRDLVKQALEGGSKEIKVAAISCLGAEPEDLQFLVEQAGAKAQDVRGAAYEALSAIDDPAAVAVLQKAIAGKDLNLAVRSIMSSGRAQPARLTSLLVAEVRKGADELVKQKDKKKASELADRLTDLIRALPNEENPDANRVTLDLFVRRADLAKVKGATFSGSDVVEAVLEHMEEGPKSLRQALARAHADLDPDQVHYAVRAGRSSLPAAELYDQFAPHVTAKVDEKKKGKDPARIRRDAVLSVISDPYISWYWGIHEDEDDGPPLDLRWLDLGVKVRNIGLVHAARRPGHPGAEKFLQEEFDAQSKTAKRQEQLDDLLSVMIHMNHPKATDNLLASYEKTIGKASADTFWCHRLIPHLPRASLPKLEAIVPRLKGPEADAFVEAIQELRSRKD